MKLTNNAGNEKFEYYRKTIPKVKTTIHWWDLYGGHYIGIDKELQKQILKEAIEKSGNISELGRKLSVGRKRISEYAALLHRPNIHLLRELCNYIGFSKKDVEKNVSNIGKYYNFQPRLPFKLHNKDGIEIRAAFLCDGHVPSNPIQCPIYSACEEELHWKLIRSSNRIFGNFPCEPRKGNKTPQTRLPGSIGTALELAGVPRGDKRLIDVSVPEDIFFGSKYIQRIYLRRVFDDEGDVSLSRRGVRMSRSSDITDKFSLGPRLIPGKWQPYEIEHGNRLVEQEVHMLANNGITPKIYHEGVYLSKNKRITSKWRVNIIQQDNINEFAKKINFNVKDKREKLQRVLNSFKIKEFPNGVGECFAIETLRPIYKEHGFFKFGDLGRALVKSGRSYDLAGRYLKILSEKKIIRKIKHGNYVFIN